MEIPDSKCLVVGDFNSHSEAWGYKESDQRGDEVEDWQIDNRMLLLNDPQDPPTFFSRAWLTTTTPDLAFATGDVTSIAERHVMDQLGGSDHKPVLITLDINNKTPEPKPFPRWKLQKGKLEPLLTA